MSQVYLITTKNCPKCIAMKALLRTAMVGLVGVSVKELDSATDEAIDVAVKYGADSVPSLIVNGKVFQISGKGCNVVEIRNALNGTK